MKQYYVYILTNISKRNTYIGVTNDLVKRVYQHKEVKIDSYTKRYNVSKLVYYEIYNDINEAIKIENSLKVVQEKRK